MGEVSLVSQSAVMSSLGSIGGIPGPFQLSSYGISSSVRRGTESESFPTTTNYTSGIVHHHDHWKAALNNNVDVLLFS